jgi:hypothetical protein
LARLWQAGRVIVGRNGRIAGQRFPLTGTARSRCWDAAAHGTCWAKGSRVSVLIVSRGALRVDASLGRTSRIGGGRGTTGPICPLFVVLDASVSRKAQQPQVAILLSDGIAIADVDAHGGTVTVDREQP